jgi:hypothetical protein
MRLDLIQHKNNVWTWIVTGPNEEMNRSGTAQSAKAAMKAAKKAAGVKEFVHVYMDRRPAFM